MKTDVEKLQEAIETWTLRNGMDFVDEETGNRQIAFYTPEEWRTRGEMLLGGEQLVMAYDGCGFWSFINDYGDWGDHLEEFHNLVEDLGFWQEMLDTWCIAFFRRDDLAAVREPEMSYFDQLRDPRWKRKAERIKARAGYTCRECKRSDVELHAHHTYYRLGFRAWEYPEDTLLCLCKSCHDKRHVIELRWRTEATRFSSEELTILLDCLNDAFLSFDRARVFDLVRAMGNQLGRDQAASIFKAVLRMVVTRENFDAWFKD